MLKKAMAALEVMKAGKRVNNPEAWKSGQVKANHVAALLSAGLVFVGLQFGWTIEVGEDQLLEISTALVGIAGFAYSMFNTISTVVSTNKVGVSGKRQAPNRGGGSSAVPGDD